MKALIDTHAFLWWITDDSRLSIEVLDFVADSTNELYFSAVSGWEIAIKHGLGKLSLPSGDLTSFISEQLSINALITLPVQVNHALFITSLPHIHKDPFDRMLIAQALVERMPIITSDIWIRQYKIQTIW